MSKLKTTGLYTLNEWIEDWGVAEVVEHLPSKLKALNSNYTTP
jgi:hypothetical protein